MSPQPIDCPACGRRMTEENFGSALVDVCDGCHGLWFDRGELDRLDSRTKGAGPALERILNGRGGEPRIAVLLRCPRCEGELTEEERAQAEERGARRVGDTNTREAPDQGWSAIDAILFVVDITTWLY